MRLSELHVGDKAEVTGLEAEGSVRRRLLDMGLISGTRFKVLRVAPLGDPVEIFFKGMYLSLRKSEAEGVLVSTHGRLGDSLPMGRQLHRRRNQGGVQ